MRANTLSIKHLKERPAFRAMQDIELKPCGSIYWDARNQSYYRKPGRHTRTKPSRKLKGFVWEQRESNPRPSACKADALNQLSYAPELGLQIYDDFLIMQTFFHYICNLIQWGCFGFDSIRHWAVSTPGVGSLPVNLSFRTYSWQQLLCTRCVVC